MKNELNLQPQVEIQQPQLDSTLIFSDQKILYLSDPIQLPDAEAKEQAQKMSLPIHSY